MLRFEPRRTSLRGPLARALRVVLGIGLGAGLVACSAKPPPAGEPPRTTANAQVQASAPPTAKPVTPTPPPDPREALLSAAISQLLENEHLLHKPIDDELSRTAFATYMDRLDASKMFLLKKDHDSLAKYADKIDDELHSGSLDLAHEGTKVFVARVEVVEKVVAELLGQPFDHNDEEFVELDPKKIEIATTEDELRDRWRKRLELEVMRRVSGMEARLKADDKKKPAIKSAVKKPKQAAPGKAPEPNKPPGPGPDGAARDLDATQNKDDATEGAADDDDAPAVAVGKIPATPEGREEKARTDLAKTYAARFTRLKHPGVFDPASELINAVTASYDPHTDYLPPADKANFDIRMSGSLEGIGALLRERDDYVEIVELVPGGASWRDGTLKPGDLILSVATGDQEPVDIADMRLDDVVKMIRGPKGSVVHLRIQKQSGAQKTVAITRDVVVVEETYARGALIQHKGQPTYGYIHLPSFYGGRGPGQRTAAGDVRKLLTEMKAKKVAGVILDIRGNGGGLLGDAIEMTGSLINQGPVVQVQNNRGRRETLSDDEAGTDYDGPVIVMVDHFSASASEIVAGALQDYHRALIVGLGPTTHGKGTVQTLADLDRVTGGKIDLGVLKITIQQFFRVSGSSTQREGVKADVVLPDPSAHIKSGESELEHAIPWSQIPPAQFELWPAKWNVKTLAERSAVRVAKQPGLAKMAAVTELLKADRDDTRIPLARAAWEAHNKAQQQALEAASPDLKKEPAHLVVKSLDDAAPVAAGPNGNKDDRIARWRDGIARDPWLDECVNILGDMAAAH